MKRHNSCKNEFRVIYLFHTYSPFYGEHISQVLSINVHEWQNMTKYQFLHDKDNDNEDEKATAISQVFSEHSQAKNGMTKREMSTALPKAGP